MPTMLEPASPQTLVQQLAGVEAKPLWLGPCAEGPNGGITQSMLQSYLGCRERFRLKYVLGLEPQPRFSKAMEYGNLHHAAEEALAANKPWEPAVDAYASKLLDKYPIQRDEVTKWWAICRMQFPEYVRHWQDHPDVVDRRPLMQEQVFDVPYRLPSGRVARLRGKFDSVDLIPSQGGIYIQENKSKGDIEPMTLERQLHFDLQTLTYQVALQELVKLDPNAPWHSPSHPICGVRYNVVRRPLSGGRGNIKQHEAKTTKARYGTGKNSGKLLAAAVHTPAETLEQFVERLRRDYIAADPDYWFFRIISRVSQNDIMDFRRHCLDPLLENVADDAEWFIWCLENGYDHWEYRNRRVNFPDHAQRHFRFPFGVWLPLNEGGATDYDHMLETGNASGLRRAESLFSELKDA